MYLGDPHPLPPSPPPQLGHVGRAGTLQPCCYATSQSAPFFSAQLCKEGFAMRQLAQLKTDWATPSL